MHIRPLDPGTATDADVAGLHAVLAATLAVDRPGHPPRAVREVAAELRTPLSGRRRLWFVAEEDGRTVGLLIVRLRDLDNRHLGMVDLAVHPDARRRGVGTALLRRAVEVLAADGRRSLLAECDEGTSGDAFCRAYGLRPVQVDQISQLRLADVDWPAVAAAAGAGHPGYRLVHWVDGCPEELVARFARAKAAMNDAPTDDIDVEPRAWPVADIRFYERQCREQGLQVPVLAAVHDATGDIAGFTELELTREAPPRADQGDTAVVPAHRGSGLGWWLKTAMLVRLRADRPDVARVVAGNASSNAHMLRINERLGYRPLVRLVEWQGDVPALAQRLDRNPVGRPAAGA